MPHTSAAARTSQIIALMGGTFLPSFLGLAATRVWLQVNLFASYTQSDDGLFTVVNNLAYGLVMVIGAAIALHKPFSKGGRTAVAWLGFTVMTFSTVLILAGKETGAVEILAVASVLAGIGGALGGGMWTAAYVRLGLRQSVLYGFLSLALGSVGGLAVFGLALGISRGFPAGEPVPMDALQRVVHQMGVVIISLFIIWWFIVKRKRLSFSFLWRIEIMLVAVGMLILSVFPGHFTGLAIATVNIADTLMLGVLWITLQDVARHATTDVYAVYGFAWASRVLSRDAGRVLIMVLGAVGASSYAVTAVIGIVVFALAASMALLLSDGILKMRPLFAEDEAPKPERRARGRSRRHPLQAWHLKRRARSPRRKRPTERRPGCWTPRRRRALRTGSARNSTCRSARRRSRCSSRRGAARLTSPTRCACRRTRCARTRRTSTRSWTCIRSRN